MVGTTLGIVAAYRGGRIETVIMRIVDLQLSFPAILLALVLVALLGQGKTQLITALVAAQYAYFARTYGWEVVGAVQPSNFEDPQPKEIARIIDQVRERELPVIFGSEVFPSKVLEQIAAETGARYEDTLRDDDLPGEPGDPEHSWLGLMRYDYVTMIKGLGGTTKALETLDVSDVAPDRASYPQ